MVDITGVFQFQMQKDNGTFISPGYLVDISLTSLAGPKLFVDNWGQG